MVDPVHSRRSAIAANRASGALADDPLWYRDAVIYQVHVRAFLDTSGDGVGDFAGLTQKLDYIQSLGVSAIWLLPFYPSPLRDDGYDIADYEGVHPQYGTRRDFLAFLNAAHERGLRVITELVINHTSDQHPWFQAARRAPAGSSKRNFYVWSDTDQKYANVPIVFKDTEPSNWSWDPVAGQYYWHRFFRHQPDLNFDNPVVARAVLKVMRFWLDMGVDGMRLDAVPYLVEREGTQCANLPETHAILKLFRREMDARHRNRMLLAEANQWPSDVRAYFGDGDECHMAFHFPLMPRLYMALRQEDRHPLSEILYQMPDLPEGCQWAIFLRNHDELTLEMVSDEERDYMYEAYAADPMMRLNAGIRRRLAPLMENSRPRIELMTGLLLSMPGTPVIYYGDELGMGDNVYLGDRNGVRTPMQWSADRNGGFSRADPARLYLPTIMDPVYGFQSVNVEAQERSSHSLLNWMRRIITLRQRHVTFGRGAMELLRPENRRIFAFLRRHQAEDPILVVANLSRTVQPVTLDLSSLAGLFPIEMFGGVELPRIGTALYPLTLGPHGFYWLRLQKEPPVDHTSRPRPVPEPDPDQAPLLLGPEWYRMLDGSVRQTLERRHLRRFLARQPWFFTPAAELTAIAIDDWGTVRAGDEPVLITMVSAMFGDGTTARYCLPLAVTGGSRADDILRESPEAVLVPVAGARKGVLHARVDGRLGAAMLDVVLGDRVVRLRRGSLRGRRLPAADRLGVPTSADQLPSAPRDQERFPSCAFFGERLTIKILRRVWNDASPEGELEGFVAVHPHFPRVPTPLAVLEYEDDHGQTSQAALAFEFVAHQTTAWRHTLDELSRTADQAATHVPPPGGPERVDTLWAWALPPDVEQMVGAYARVAARLGQRVADLHRALTSPDARAAFGSDRWDSEQVAALEARILGHWQRLLRDWPRQSALRDGARAALARLEAKQELVATLVRAAREQAPPTVDVARTHGNLDLTQVLIYESDVSFIGFEGDARVPPKDRRRLRSVVEDVAGMVWSIQNAGEHALASRRAGSPQDQDRVERWVRWWVAGSVGTFLRAYADAMTDSPFLPAPAPSRVALLRLFLLERAFRELADAVTSAGGWVETLAVSASRLIEPSDSSASPPSLQIPQ
ncbi:MAG: maltose alpha-D-glucosyltransferase [Acidobacteria bacterium]|nr:maltose alpha-D-glucosyltransferase [Acidobacteriota bacterium]